VNFILVTLGDDQHPVQAFAPSTPHPALGVAFALGAISGNLPRVAPGHAIWRQPHIGVPSTLASRPTFLRREPQRSSLHRRAAALHHL